MKIIAITAIWCPSCLFMKNTIHKIEKKYEKLMIEEHDYDADADFCKSLAIGTKLPVYILYKDGKEVERIIGEKKEKELIEIIERHGV